MALKERLTVEERMRARRAEKAQRRHDRRNREKIRGKRWQEKAERMPEGSELRDRLHLKSEILLQQGEQNDIEFNMRNAGVEQSRIDAIKGVAFTTAGVLVRPVVDALDLLGRTSFAVGAAADETLEAVAGEGTPSRRAIKDILGAGTNQFTFVPKETDIPGISNPWNRVLLGMARKTHEMLQSGELQEAATSAVNQYMAYEVANGGIQPGTALPAAIVGRVAEELFSGVDAMPVPDSVLSVAEFTGALPQPMIDAAREWDAKTKVEGEKKGLLIRAKELGVDPGDSFSAALDRLTHDRGTFDIVPGVQAGFSDSGQGLLVFEKGGLLDFTSLGFLGMSAELATDPITFVTAGTGGAIRVGGRTLSAKGVARFRAIMDDMLGVADDIGLEATTQVRAQASRQLLEEARQAPELLAPRKQVRFMGQEIFNFDKPDQWVAGLMQGDRRTRLKKAVEGFGEELGRLTGSESVSNMTSRIGSRIQSYLDYLDPELSKIDEFIVSSQAASGKASAKIRRTEDILDGVDILDEADNARLLRVATDPVADAGSEAERIVRQVADEIDEVYRGLDQLATKEVTEADLRSLLTVLQLGGNADRPVVQRLAQRLNTATDWVVNPVSGERSLRRTEVFFNNSDRQLTPYFADLAEHFRGKIDIPDLQKALRAHTQDPRGGEVGRLFDALIATQQNNPQAYTALQNRIVQMQKEAAEILLAKGDQGSALSILTRDDILELMTSGQQRTWNKIRPVTDAREHLRRRASLAYTKHAQRELAWTVWNITKGDEIARRIFEKHMIPVGDLERALTPAGVRRVDDAVRNYVDHVQSVRSKRKMRKALPAAAVDTAREALPPAPKGRPMPGPARKELPGSGSLARLDDPAQRVRPLKDEILPENWDDIEAEGFAWREGHEAIFRPWETALSKLQTPEELQLFFRKWVVGDGMMSTIRQDPSATLATRIGLLWSSGLGEIPSGFEPRRVHWFSAEGAAMRQALRKNGLTFDDLIPSANMRGMIAEDGTNFVPFHRLVWGADGRPKLLSKQQAIIHNGGKPVYLPNSLVKALDRLTEQSIKSPATGRILAHYDKATNFIKLALTAVGGYPSFQLRNAYTNFFLAGTEAHLHLLAPGSMETSFRFALNGVDPRLALSKGAHFNALRMRAANIAALDPAGLDQAGVVRALRQSLASSKRGRKILDDDRAFRQWSNEIWEDLNRVVIRPDPDAPVPRGFRGYTNADLMRLVHETGIDIDPRVLSEFVGHAEKFKNRNVAARASLWFKDKALRNNQFWEQWSRQQMFFAYLARGFDPQDAARFAKKALFDYLALSPGEREFAKRIIPFYTFYRKALPFMLESIIRRPGPMAVQARLLREDPNDPSMVFGSQMGERYVVRSNGKIHQVGNIDHPINTLRFMSAFYAAMGGGKPHERTAMMKHNLREVTLMLHPIVGAVVENATHFELFTEKKRSQKKLDSLGLALDKAGMLDGQLGNLITKREFGQGDVHYYFDKGLLTALVQTIGAQRLVSNADRIVDAMQDFSDGELTGLVRWTTGLKAESMGMREQELEKLELILEETVKEAEKRDAVRRQEIVIPTEKGKGLDN